MTISAGVSLAGASFLLTCLLRGMTVFCFPLVNYRQFLLTCLLRGMTGSLAYLAKTYCVSTHMPLTRHDMEKNGPCAIWMVSTHMPLTRHATTFLMNGKSISFLLTCLLRGMTCLPAPAALNSMVSTHMPLTRHDRNILCFLCNHATIYKNQTF